MKHLVHHDYGKDTDGKYAHGRDCRNIIATCSCGWAYSNTYREVEHRSVIHVEIFERNEERRSWNNPGRRTNMPGHTW